MDWRRRIGRNLSANAGSQIVAFALNLIAVPIFLRLLGSESYALIGFGITVQIWVNLLDLGFSPIFTRDLARLSAGVLPESDVHSFLRSMDWVLVGINIAALAFAIGSAGYWAEAWFEADRLGADVIGQSMALIILFSAVRLASAFYRSGLLGLERQISVAVINVVANVGRLIVPIGLILIFKDVRAVFITWVVVSLAEVLTLRLMLGKGFSGSLPFLKFSFPSIRVRLPLSGQIALSALLWTTVTQIDKLILSRSLTLYDYGHFSLAVVLAGGIAMVPVPVITAFQPQIAAAAALEDLAKVRQLLRSATRILAVTTLVPALIVALNADIAIFAWTGDKDAAQSVAPYLGAYLVATAILGFGSLLYSLQVAYGKVTLPLIANILFAVILVPSMSFVAQSMGALGAAYLWLAMTLGLAVTYFPLVLHRFLRGCTRQWYFSDIAVPTLCGALAGFLPMLFSSIDKTRVSSLLIIGFALALGGALSVGAAILLARRPAREISISEKEG